MILLSSDIQTHKVKAKKEKGAIVVTGARQVGKTTLIEKMMPGIAHLTFDDLSTQ